MNQNVIFDELRDPFESLAPSETEGLCPGSVIISGAGARWRRTPYYGHPFQKTSKWWNGHTEVATAELYKGADVIGEGEHYWLVIDAAEPRCEAPAEPEGDARDDVWTKGCPASGCTRLWRWDGRHASDWVHESD